MAVTPERGNDQTRYPISLSELAGWFVIRPFFGLALQEIECHHDSPYSGECKACLAWISHRKANLALPHHLAKT